MTMINILEDMRKAMKELDQLKIHFQDVYEQLLQSQSRNDQMQIQVDQLQKQLIDHDREKQSNLQQQQSKEIKTYEHFPSTIQPQNFGNIRSIDMYDQNTSYDSKKHGQPDRPIEMRHLSSEPRRTSEIQQSPEINRPSERRHSLSINQHNILQPLISITPSAPTPPRLNKSIFSSNSQNKNSPIMNDRRVQQIEEIKAYLKPEPKDDYANVLLSRLRNSLPLRSYQNFLQVVRSFQKGEIQRNQAAQECRNIVKNAWETSESVERNNDSFIRSQRETPVIEVVRQKDYDHQHYNYPRTRNDRGSEVGSKSSYDYQSPHSGNYEKSHNRDGDVMRNMQSVLDMAYSQ